MELESNAKNVIRLVSTSNATLLDYIEIIGTDLYEENPFLQSRKAYQIENKENGLSLTLNHDKLSLEKYNAALIQKFVFTYNDYGFYGIYPASIVGYNKALTWVEPLGKDGRKITISAILNSPAQKWAILPVEGGYYRIVNKVNGKCMQSRFVNGSNGLDLAEYRGSSNQEWKLRVIDAPLNMDTTALCFQHEVKRGSAIEAACRVTEIGHGFRYFPVNTYGNAINAIDLYKNKLGSCVEESTFQALVGRAFGIPVAIDFTPLWPSRSLGHQWNVAFSEQGQALQYVLKSKPGTINPFAHYRESKVFRRTFSRNPNSLAEANTYTEDIPLFFRSPYLVDVTEEYSKTSDVSVTISLNKATEKHFSYLCTFNNKEWVPIFWGENVGDAVTFKSMGWNVVYLPAAYKDGRLIPISDCILLDENGLQKKLAPDENKKQTLVLKRKHPFLKEEFYHIKFRSGGRFQGANAPDFSDAITLCTITDIPDGNYHILQSSVDRKFRYLRYIGPDSTNCNINELAFFDENGNELKGEIVGTDG